MTHESEFDKAIRELKEASIDIRKTMNEEIKKAYFEMLRKETLKNMRVIK